MPLILAIETATKLCSVAVARDGKVLALCEVDSERHAHAEKVNVFVAEVMAEAGYSLKDLDAVAVGIGPGSYTGLRIGLSAAKGLCYVLGIPLIGINTLHTIARAALAEAPLFTGDVWAMVDARRMEVFAQPHDASGSALAPHAPLILSPEWAAEAHVLVCGDGADKATELWSYAPNVIHLHGVRPTAAAMFAEAERRMANGQFDDLAYLVPDYGKAANVTQPKKRAV
ncbi:MAG: tRNA (adenosine(37)-N6)-threonylcarbamoyltransferase complex dimerization subunit type 1 TsaB [Flavobacteriales bacterium]|nr:tRNA (adenosine(37)-N6)-threonylcarbamoyltransferase complex dimerization subunit type 1 TsaB [Flavobacteriales bacterium]